MVRARPEGAFNRHRFDHRYELMAGCCFETVQATFSHLSMDQIRKPPRHFKDAQLARQIAIRLMAVDFSVEQRQISRMQARQRTSIHFAIQTIDERMECGVFRAAYDRMAEQALRLYELKMQKAGA